jgi:hypothetical protein
MARSMFRISLALFFAALLALRADAQQLVQGTTPTGALYAFANTDRVCEMSSGDSVCSVLSVAGRFRG